MADFHAENRYFRILPLGALGIVADLEVSRVRVGIREALGQQARVPVAVRLHTLVGEPLVTNLTQIAEQRIEVSGEAPTQVDVPFSHVVVPAGSTLVVEVFLPGLERRGDLVTGLTGSDAHGLGLLAATCAAEPVPIDTTPDVHLVIAVIGRER